MSFKRIKQNKLHKLFLKCFGSLTNSARALGYKNKDPIYKVIHSDRKLNKKKVLAGFEKHEKNLAKLKKMLLDD